MSKKLAMVFGIVLVLVGILGFVGGAGIVGPTGVFATDTLHDIIHLVVGLVLLAVALMSPSASALWLKIFGVVFLVLAVLGFLLVPSGGMLLGLVEVNMMDHILHLVLGIVFFGAGYYGSKSSMSAPAPMSGATM